LSSHFAELAQTSLSPEQPARLLRYHRTTARAFWPSIISACALCEAPEATSLSDRVGAATVLESRCRWWCRRFPARTCCREQPSRLPLRPLRRLHYPDRRRHFEATGRPAVPQHLRPTVQAQPAVVRRRATAWRKGVGPITAAERVQDQDLHPGSVAQGRRPTSQWPEPRQSGKLISAWKASLWRP